jgi:peptide/nickel transport system permease protein
MTRQARAPGVVADQDGELSIGRPGEAIASPWAARRRGRGLAEVLRRVARRQPLGIIGAFIVLALILAALFAAGLAPHGPKESPFETYQAPSRAYLLGTDHLGRDVLSRVIWGARLSLYVGLVSVGVGVTLGAMWGIISAYFGGALDAIGERVVDTLMAFPPIILALGLMAVLGQSVENVNITLAVLLAPSAARSLRSTTLSLKEMTYVEAARAAGCSHRTIIFRHILPNTLATYIVLFSVNVAYAIVVEAALSFLGLGAPPDEPSWGGMLTAAAQSIETAPWIALFPGLALSLTVFGLNLMGDAIRDLADPRLRGGLE